MPNKNPDNCCNDFTRSQFLHKAAASAGAGLPDIERGMPDPAGTGMSRRSFVMKSLGALVTVYGVSKLNFSFLEEDIALAASNNRVIVSVFLEGGADALSVLAPDGDPLYQKLRPNIWLPPSQTLDFSEDDRLRWHPAMQGLATLHDEGKVSVIPAIGYTHADQSHFTSRHYWEVGATSTQINTGWLGRYLDQSGSMDNPIQGLSLNGYLSPALASEKVPIASVDGVAGYTFEGANIWGEVQDELNAEMKNFVDRDYGDRSLSLAASVSNQSGLLREQLVPLVPVDDNPPYTSPVPYPVVENEDFPQRLAGLAAALAIGLPITAVAISAPGGYDTHSDQEPGLGKNLKLTADSLLAFQRDLESRGIADRVLIHVWSEFGRRAEENGSGTDHGAAGVGFLIGSQVKGQMIGEFPGLKDGLDADGNLKATADFRGLYSSILEEWFATDAKAIIPDAASFARVPILR